MKILHTADWHIGNFSGPVDKDGQNLRAVDTGMCLNQLHDIALLRKPDMILVSGDIFHQARVWADRGLTEVQTAIRVIEALGRICPVVVMRGTPNHDGPEQFESLRTYFATSKAVRVITHPCVIQVRGVNIACLPGFDRGVFRAKFPGLSKEDECRVFTEEISKIVLGLKAKCDPSLKSVLMAHYTVPGCNTESGQTQFFAQFEPVLMPETLDAAGWDLVAMGHIHRPQQVESCHNTFYCGAVNALNFNDEGQKRGFYIHDLDAGTHTFYETPARQFLTVRLDGKDIDAYITEGYLPGNIFSGAKGKIVRVLYTCTEEQHKALNRAQMERDLYDAFGAFWVAGIEPEQVTIGTNKDELSEKTDPEKNLVSYLKEKGIPDTAIGEIVEAARPIIAEATAGSRASRYSGAFIPISIEVRNYRNYADEHFDFKDISFCTINGKNGAGKSSLFMDAILDCLFEEPREGDLTGWIRADESARSGSIIFTFSIGDHTFRVTRTRTKSGKATLNISEFVNGDWQDRSSEKIKDTQAAIIDILGMDSLTFRSCALIMQDQYGLFMEASKEDRMTILGNILSLGIYDSMGQIAHENTTEANRQISQREAIVSNLSKEISTADSVKSEFDAARRAAEAAKIDLDSAVLRKENISLKLSKRREAWDKAEKLTSDIHTAEEKNGELARQLCEQRGIIRSADSTLQDEAVIHANAAQSVDYTRREKDLLQQRSAAAARLEALNATSGQIDSLKGAIDQAEKNRSSAEQRIAATGQKIAEAQRYAEAAEKLKTVLSGISGMESKERAYRDLSTTISDAQASFSDAEATYRVEAAERKRNVETYQAKARMLQDSQCVNVEKAACRFLADAKAAQRKLETYIPECTAWKKGQLQHLDKLKSAIAVDKAKLQGIGYDAASLMALRSQADSLRPQAAEYSKIGLYNEMLTRENENKKRIEQNLSEEKKRLEGLEVSISDMEALKASLGSLDAELKTLHVQIDDANAWVEKEKQLPVAAERKATAQRRLVEIQTETSDAEKRLSDLRADYNAAMGDAAGKDELEAQLKDAAATVAEKQSLISAIHTKLGGLEERLEQINRKKEEIREIQDEVNTFSHKAAIYDTLKSAFSQDGIPHNIIRSMLPMLTTTANTILGQMTGGRMGMEFITDRVLKANSRKEVPTLDIVINEYGKDSLPYLSKSGGEKVKASLSAILSLAEIKSSQAGIQLGMLFIDEPPFLDADGIQAYCDALETIQHRYSGLKVMAITHDPAMKSRFPQSIDVVKDDAGSHVLME